MLVSRNSRCPCGSGKKYKRCCLLAHEATPPLSASRNPRALDPALSPPSRIPDSTSLTLQLLKQMPYERLFDYFPADHLQSAITRFFKHPIDPSLFQVDADEAEELIRFTLVQGMETWSPVRTTASSAPNGPIRTGCDCDRGRKDGCEHQDFLVFALWALFHLDTLPGAPGPGQPPGQLKEIGRAASLLRARIETVERQLASITVRLESLLICLDHPEAWEPRKTESNRAALRDSPPSHFIRPSPLPKPGDFLQNPVARGVTTYEIPHCFLDSYGISKSLSHDPKTERLANLLQYGFSDGQVLNSGEIFFHPLGRRVPLNLLPLRSTLRPGFQWLNPRIQGISIPLWMNEGTEAVLVSALLAASERGVPIHLVQGQGREFPRPAHRLEKIEIDSESSSGGWHAYLPSQITPERHAPPTPGELARGWTLLGFEPKTDDPDPLLFQGFYLNLKTSRLVFHTFNRSLAEVNSLLGAPPDGRSRLEVVFRGHEARQSIQDHLNPMLQSKGLPPVRVHLPAPRRLVSPEFRPEIHFRSREGDFAFSVFFEDNGQSWRAWNLPHPARSLALLLRDGIGTAHKGKNTDLAHSSDPAKRERDLKALRHLGLAALLAGELTSYFLNGQTADGKPLLSDRDLWTHLDQRLGAVLLQLEAPEIQTQPVERTSNETRPLFSKLCSRNVVTLTRGWIEDTLREARREQNCELLFADHAVQWDGATRVSWRVIHQLIRGVAIESGGKCFQKPRLGAFERIAWEIPGAGTSFSALLLPSAAPAPMQYPVHSAWLPTPRAWLRAFLPLQEAGFTVYLDDRVLEPLSSSDLQARIEFGGDRPAPADQADQAAQAPEATQGPIDWFELHPRLFFRGVEVDPTNLARWNEQGILEHQGRFYFISEKNLPSLRRLETFWKKLKSGPGSPSGGRWGNESHVFLPRSEVLELLALRASGATFTENPEFDEICRFYDELGKPRELIPLPGSLRIELKPYQRIGVQWLHDLYRLRLGGILADEMGLGKTPQTLCFLELLRSRSEMGHALIVVPTSLTFNWKAEAERFAPGLPVHSFQGRSKVAFETFLSENPQGVVICTYGLLAEHIETFEKRAWNIAIFDEAQNLKNLTAQRTGAARRLKARFKACLTGTPIENHLGEFFSLLDLVVPGCLGDYTEFRQRYVSSEQVQAEDIGFLRLKARPLLLRRTKSEILSELPPKMESTVRLPFEKRQEKIYRNIALSCNEKIKTLIEQKGEARTQLEMLAALLRLRQACSDPSGLPGISYKAEPPKLSVLRDALAEVTESGESALVFTQFLASFERLQSALRAVGIPTHGIQGSTSPRERERILREFQESPRGSVLLLTLKTGGVGLNLTRASYVFHLDPWWNPAVENQATDRAHRIGQKRAVQVFHYLIRDSVEEKIEVLKARKKATFDALLSSENLAEGETDFASGGTPGLTRRRDSASPGLLTREDFNYLIH